MLALLDAIAVCSSAFSTLDHSPKDYDGIHSGALTLFKILMKMYVVEKFRDFHAQPLVISPIIVFVIITVVLLLYLLIAQVDCAFNAVYVDAVSYTRPERRDIIVETMPPESLQLNRCSGCSEGDIGAADGTQNSEPARLSPTVLPISATARRAARSCCVLGCCCDMWRALSGRCFAQPGMSEKSYFRIASVCQFHHFRLSQDVYSVGFVGSADLSTQLLAEDEEGDDNDHGISSLSCRTLSRTRFFSGR